MAGRKKIQIASLESSFAVGLNSVKRKGEKRAKKAKTAEGYLCGSLEAHAKWGSPPVNRAKPKVKSAG
ncbi:hypothetical protein IQ241_08005 [Romeria aff. gracilis LEGE 07310]|uniref:Uncharacterized protein n=1 Tax=Vasconcelosia minhoensis LEGE 07310 TaxID=915328 RepID=A0A8J7A616_9CYAN|nr:hypothetical protein [Romeria aff. gracilis LEGE 07310]